MNGAYQQINPEPMQPTAEPPRGGGSGWMAWVVGIFMVLLVGGGLYYYYQYIKIPELNTKVDNLQRQVDELNKSKESSTPTDETADWKTYSGNQYGLSFKYPKNYTTKVSNVSLVGDVKGNQIFVGEAGKLTRAASMNLLVFPEKSSYSLMEPNGMDPISDSSTTVGGKDAKKYVGDDADVYVVVANNRRFEIYKPNTLTQDEKDNFDTILSTFQFTD